MIGGLRPAKEGLHEVWGVSTGGEGGAGDGSEEGT